MTTSSPKKEYKPLLAQLTDQEGEELCAQLRRELVEDVSSTGGHLASNLGAVELTVALHRVFDTSVDRLVFDVGHQCYTHKMLTGRREAMSTLRQYGGVAGFPKPSESVHDAFIAGHASNSVAVALGMARARTMLGEGYRVIALIGDGALTGGLAYEGLSNAGDCGRQLLVILNDNGMSITPNVGGVADHLAKQRMKPQYLTFKKHYRRIMNATGPGRVVYRVVHRVKQALKQSMLPCSMFENMGFRYLGPVDGHNLPMLTKILSYARDMDEPVLLHVKTVKGKGFLPAEENPDEFHGVAPFDPTTGRPKRVGGENFSAVFGRTLTRLAGQDRRVCAITAAMTGDRTGRFARQFPDRFFDVGIAEGCALSMAAGMAKQGAIPVFAVYSTFLQRAYDMLLHDAAIDNLHVVLGVDRTGLVGDDGETHHGLFDAAYLDSVPNMTVLAPASFAELEVMLERALFRIDGPVAVRYPRGGEGGRYLGTCGEDPAAILRQGSDITLVSYGTEINEVLEAAELLEAQGVQAEIVKLNQLTPLVPELVELSVRKTGALLVAEEQSAKGCVGQRLAARLEVAGLPAKVALVNCGPHFVPHGAANLLKRDVSLDGAGLAKKGLEVLGRGETAS